MAPDHIACVYGLICYYVQPHLLNLHSVFNYHLNWYRASSENTQLKLMGSPHGFPAIQSRAGLFQAALPWLTVFWCMTDFLQLTPKQLFPFLLSSILLKGLVLLG